MTHPIKKMRRKIWLFFKLEMNFRVINFDGQCLYNHMWATDYNRMMSIQSQTIFRECEYIGFAHSNVQ